MSQVKVNYYLLNFHLEKRYMFLLQFKKVI